MSEKGTFTSGLQKVLENVNRTGYAGSETLRNLIASIKGEEDFNPGEAFTKGITLKKKTAGADIIDEVVGAAPGDASGAEKFTRTAAGLVIDVLADPLTFVGIGGLTKAGKIAKSVEAMTKLGKKVNIASKLGKKYIKMPKTAQILGKTMAEQGAKGQRAIVSFGDKSLLGPKADSAALGFIEKASGSIRNAPYIREVLDKGDELFSMRTGDTEFDNLMHERYAKIYQGEEKVLALAKEMEKQLKELTPKELKDIESYLYYEGRENFTQRVVPEQGKLLLNKGTTVRYSPKVEAIGEKLKGLYDDMFETEMEKGIIKDKIDGYIPGIGTKELVKLAQKLRAKTGMTSSEFDNLLGFTLQKKITSELTPSQANALFRRLIGSDISPEAIRSELKDILTKNAINSIEGIKIKSDVIGQRPVKAGTQFFVEDPALQYAARGMKHVHAVNNAEFLENVTKFGRSEQEWTKLPMDQKIGWQTVKIKGLEGLRFPRKVASALTRHSEAMSNEKVVNSFLKGYKGLINFWKRWTLTPFSAYHARNAIGNVWNNYITAGIINPYEYIRAAKLQVLDKAGDAAKIKNFKIMTDAGEEVSGDTLLNEMKGHGLFGSTRSSEVPEDIANKMKGPSLNPLDENFALIRGGRIVGDSVEMNGKITHYLNRRIAGEAPAQAAMSTKAALFDYSELTPFEKQYMRFVFPFWAWTRNNIPLQLKSLIENPGRYSALAKAKTNIESQAGTEDTNMKWMPEWMRDSFPIILDKMPEADRFKVFLLTSWLPAGDIDKLFNPIDMATSSLEPFSKELFQQATNKDFYLKREIESYPGDVSSMMGIEMPARLKHGLKIFRLLNWVDQLNPNNTFGEYKGKKSWTGATRETIDLKGADKVASSFLGAKVYPYDIKQGQTYMKAKSSKEISSLRIARKKALRTGDENKAARLAKLIQNKQMEAREK
jgi:hypothetical protein